MRYEHPLIAFLLIGVVQEADLVIPGFEQSRAISNRSTLDYTLHCGEQRIVLPGDASWKRLCSSSVPPDDDDDSDDPAIIVLICHECDRSELAQLLFLNRFLRFYRATLCVSAVLAVAWCLSVRPSVRLSCWCIVSRQLKI